MEKGLPLHVSHASALPGGESSFLGKGAGEMDLSWHPYWRELGRVAPHGYVPIMNIAFLSQEVAKRLNDLVGEFLEVTSFSFEDGVLRYIDKDGWERRLDFLAEEEGEKLLLAATHLFGCSSEGIDIDKFHRSMYALNYGLSSARNFASSPSDGWIRLSPYLLIEDGVISWGPGIVEDNMHGVALGLLTHAPSSAYPGDYPSEWGNSEEEERSDRISTFTPFESFLG